MNSQVHAHPVLFLALVVAAIVAVIAARRARVTHDALTELPNRLAFLRRARTIVAEATSQRAMTAVVVVDLHGLREINRSLGHDAADRLLIAAARRIEAAAPKDAVVGRVGDDFAVAATVDGIAAAHRLAGEMSSVTAAPFDDAGPSTVLAASLGIAIHPSHADDAPRLLKRAAIAAADARRARVPYAMYEAGREELSARRFVIVSELRHAVGRQQLRLEFQPIVDMRSGAVTHAEALARWRHPLLGDVAPDEFIRVAEETGQIGVVTRWVLHTVIAQVAEWTRSGSDCGVAVNVSALDLEDPSLPAVIASMLEAAAVAPSRLLVEITESAIMRDSAVASSVIDELHRRGVAIAIDDFGTGYSSLAHLKRLRADKLKIDRSFVMNLAQAEGEDIVVVRTIIELAHNMGLRVVAEGVEDHATWQALEQLECDLAQGFLISRPLPQTEFTAWINEQAPVLATG